MGREQTYKAEAAKVKKLILDDDFWAEVEVMEKVFGSVVKLLRLVDSDMPTPGMVSDTVAGVLQTITAYDM